MNPQSTLPICTGLKRPGWREAYYGVRVVKWDQMAHALYVGRDLQDHYIRVTKEEGMKIAQELLTAEWGDEGWR